MDTEKASPIEHQNVPQAHRGLHDFLYSSADEHSAETTNTPTLEHTIDIPIAVEAWCDEVQNAKVAGVYAVLDCDRQTQYIGYSRNVALSLRSHLTQMGVEVCAWVKVQPFKFPKRDEMEKLRDEWIAALPSPPPGNLNGTWAGTVKDAATQVMSAAEREAYEERKIKLRRAMADGTLHKEEIKAQSEAAQRQDLAAAMNDDNWSAVIREQTQETQAP
jgi:putative sterol carrier protein